MNTTIFKTETVKHFPKMMSEEQSMLLGFVLKESINFPRLILEQSNPITVQTFLSNS